MIITDNKGILPKKIIRRTCRNYLKFLLTINTETVIQGCSLEEIIRNFQNTYFKEHSGLKN